MLVEWRVSNILLFTILLLTTDIKSSKCGIISPKTSQKIGKPRSCRHVEYILVDQYSCKTLPNHKLHSAD